MNINVNDISKFIDNNFNVGNSRVQLRNLEIFIDYLDKNDIALIDTDSIEILIRHNKKLNIMLEKIIKLNDEEIILENENIAFLVTLYQSRKDSYLADDDNLELTTNTYKQYLNEMAKFKTLSKKEEQAIIKRIAMGDESAKKELIEANLKLVVYTVMLYFSNTPNKLDLIQEGNEALIRAVDKFDYNAGYQFSSYATATIKNRIAKYLDNYSRVIRIPQYLAQESYKVKDFIEKHIAKYGEIPNNKLISKELGIDLNHIEKILNTKEPVSLDQFKTDDQNEIVEETINSIAHPSMSRDTIEQKIFDDEFKNYIFTTDLLDERERTILIYRFGLIDNIPRGLTEVAKIIGLTHQRIKQVEDRALIKLRFSPFIQEYYEKNTDLYKIDLAGMNSRKLMKYYKNNIKSNCDKTI